MFETGTLERGDSVNFESGTPHCLSNPYDEECVVRSYLGRREAADAAVAAIVKRRQRACLRT